MAASAVVVANPIVAPRADVQIPSVALSAGSADAADMLDKEFLDAIAPTPPESTNPFSVLKQLISSLAADASYLGKNAIVDAFVAGVTAVSTPELTASAVPYLDPMELLGTPEVAMSVLPGIDLQSVVPSAAGIVPADPSALTPVPPAVKSFVTSIINDAGYVGGELVAAAFAMGAAVAAEPGLISDTIRALFDGDIRGALQNAVKVVAAPLGPSAIVVNAVATVLDKHLSGLPTLALPVGEATPAPSGGEVSVAYIVSQAPAVSSPVEQPRAPHSDSEAPDGGDVVQVPGAAAAQTVAKPRTEAAPAAVDVSADVSEPSVVEQAESGPAPVAPARPGQRLREAVTSVGTQIGAALNGVVGGANSAADGAGKAVRSGGRGSKGGAASSDDAGR